MTRTAFWQAKRPATVLRDRRNDEALATLGWDILVLWECETKDPESLMHQSVTVKGECRRRTRIELSPKRSVLLAG